MNEIWRPVRGLEDLFEVSNKGRIKRRKRLVKYSDGSVHLYKEMVLRGGTSSTGYRVVNCSVNGNRINIPVHRAVCEAFIENPNNLPFVNHKDENPQNNNVENLEWCTPKYNSNYGTCKKRIREQRIKNGYSRVVVLYDITGTVLAEFDTIKDAAKSIGVSDMTVANCCEGVSPSANGYIFRYKGDKFEVRDNKRILRTFKVYKNGKEIYKISSVVKLCKTLGINIHSFRSICKGRTTYNKEIKDYIIIALPFNTDKGFKLIGGKKLGCPI